MKNQNYYESLDKRTKEYKEYKQSKGLGDTIEKVLKKTGVKAIVEPLPMTVAAMEGETN